MCVYIDVDVDVYESIYVYVSFFGSKRVSHPAYSP